MTTVFPPLNNCTVAVVGLGYVGLPLAVEFAKPQSCRRTGASLQRRVIGFDINSQRLEELRHGFDRTNETSREELKEAQLLEFTSDPGQLADADVFVVTVPTPIDSSKRPDLTPLQKASATVGRALKQRCSGVTPLVIYESTVIRGLNVAWHQPSTGLFCGYSPGGVAKLTTIIKVIVAVHVASN